MISALLSTVNGQFRLSKWPTAVQKGSITGLFGALLFLATLFLCLSIEIPDLDESISVENVIYWGGWVLQ